jgi:NtrC-family two-component system response regulator AlgB
VSAAQTPPAAAGAARILLVDDDSRLLRNFRWALEDAGFQVSSAQDAQQARQRLQHEVFDVCFLDVMLGEDNGLELLPALRSAAPWMRVVMATAEANLQTAVKAMQSGAVDYLVKPCSPEQLVLTARRQAEVRGMERRIEQLQGDLAQHAEPITELGSLDPPTMRIFEMARQVADTDATVLILGESGTGKGVLAQAIHGWSPRRDAAFATVNCPSLSAELLESELFGHVKGAFTGAVEHRQGRVQIADGGTLFLDEIGDFPLALQPKLLRFLQDRQYERVGDPHTRTANLRLVAATNRNLAELVREGRFREDLLYRLNVIELELPPLRERAADVSVLAPRYLQQFAARYRRPAREFSAEALAALLQYGWPGNIRELRNVMERVSILCPQAMVERVHLPLPGLASEAQAALARVGAEITLEQLERAHIEAVLAQAPTLDAAATTLGVDSSTLYRKRKQYGLS